MSTLMYLFFFSFPPTAAFLGPPLRYEIGSRHCAEEKEKFFSDVEGFMMSSIFSSLLFQSVVLVCPEFISVINLFPLGDEATNVMSATCFALDLFFLIKGFRR